MARRVGLGGTRVGVHLGPVHQTGPTAGSFAPDKALPYGHGGRRESVPNRCGEIPPSAFDANNALSVTRSRLDRAMVFANPAQIRVARHVQGRAEDLDDPFACLAEGTCGRIGLEP